MRLSPVLSVSFIMFGGLFGIYTIPLLLGVLQTEGGWSSTYIGLLGSIELGAVAIMSMMSAYLQRIFSIRQIAIVGALVFFIASLLSIAIDTQLLFGSLRVVSGIGQGLMLASASAAVPHFDKSGVAYGKIFALCSLKFAALLLAIPYFHLHQSVVQYFTALTVISIILIPAAIAIPKPIAPVDHLTSNAEHFASKRWTIGLGAALLLIGTTFVEVPLGGIWSFAERLGNNVGLDPETIGLLLSISTIGGMGGSYLAGRFIHKGAILPALIIGSSLAAVSCLGISTVDTVEGYGFTIIIYNLAYMFFVSTVLACAAILDPSGALAAATSGWVLGCYALGTYFFGLLVTYYSLFSIGILGALLCFISIVLLFGFYRVYVNQYKLSTFADGI